MAGDYTKRKFVFRLHTSDGSEFLFGADSEEQQEEWVKKIKFHASLPPSQQLTSYRDFDETKENEFRAPEPPKVSVVEPVYANLPVNNGTDTEHPTAKSPPLPESQPPVSGPAGAAGTRQILKQSSRHSLQTQGEISKYFCLTELKVSKLKNKTKPHYLKSQKCKDFCCKKFSSGKYD